MIDHLNPNLLKATRLTREGRLTEATALLQQLLRAQPPAGDEPGSETGEHPNPRPGAMIIEGSFERILDSDAPQSSPNEAERAPRGDRQPKAPLTPRSRISLPDVLGTLGRTLPGLGSHGLATSSVPTAELVPVGGRFIAGFSATGRGHAPSSSICPADMTDRRFP
jgi:hypothetical protein